MLFKLNSVTIYAPLIQGVKGHSQFFSTRVKATRNDARFVPSPSGEDSQLLILKDYGCYAAGVEAKKSYLNLMYYWRKQSPIATGILSKPRQCDFEVTGKVETSIFDSRSSQLAILLGMITCQMRLPFKHIFATGELNNSAEFPIVEPIDGLGGKLAIILQYIEKAQPLEPVLIALPKYIDSNKPLHDNNSTQIRYKRRIGSFLNQYPMLDIRILYCDRLLTDLTNEFSTQLQFRQLSSRLKWLPISICLGVFVWQYLQPLQLSWDNRNINTKYRDENRPMRATLSDADGIYIKSLCPQSKAGEAVFSINDLIMYRVRIEDKSWISWLTPPETALVFVGEQSGVRVESLPEVTPYKNTFGQNYMIEYPEENYLAIAIAQKNIAIDKGKLNKQLANLIKPLTGIERLSAVSGYLEKHYNSVQYRYRIMTNCEETE